MWRRRQSCPPPLTRRVVEQLGRGATARLQRHALRRREQQQILGAAVRRGLVRVHLRAELRRADLGVVHRQESGLEAHAHLVVQRVVGQVAACRQARVRAKAARAPQEVAQRDGSELAARLLVTGDKRDVAAAAVRAVRLLRAVSPLQSVRRLRPLLEWCPLRLVHVWVGQMVTMSKAEGGGRKSTCHGLVYR